jgi:ParB family chromosome partitioning protein
MKSGKKDSQKQSNDYREVELKLIDPPDGHVRMDIPERQLFELSESMKEVGLIQAILVTPVKERYEVVVGHRRYLAARKLRWKTIKTEIREMDRNKVAVLRAIENLQREGLSPIEEAAIYVDLADKSGFTHNMIAEKMGMSLGHIKDRLRLLRLDPEIQKAIHSGKIIIEVGKILSKIGDKKEMYRYLEIAIENGVTEKVALGWTEDYRKSLQYIARGDNPPDPPEETILPTKYYAPCQICEGPIEYADMRVIKICKDCYNNLIKGLKEGGQL